MAWDTAFEASPAGADAPSTIDNKIREIKTEVRPRLNHEMLWLDTTTATGGWLRAGAAKVYFTTAAPTNRPDGATALSSDDKGRLWISAGSLGRSLRVFSTSGTHAVVPPPSTLRNGHILWSFATVTSTTVANNSGYTLPAGMGMLVVHSNPVVSPYLQKYTGAVWEGTQINESCVFISDGRTVRFYRSGGTVPNIKLLVYLVA